MQNNPFEKLNFLSDAKKDKLQEYASLLREENSKINIISRKDMDFLEYRHVAFCASIGAFFTPENSAKIADVGTGGGLPGLVMAILWENVQFTLLDGVGKKIASVKRILDALKLENVVAKQARIEEQKELFDYITGRSVCSLPEFIGFTHKALARGKNGSIENGVVYFKGGELEEELKQRNLLPSKIMKLDDFFADENFAGKTIVHIRQSVIFDFYNRRK